MSLSTFGRWPLVITDFLESENCWILTFVETTFTGCSAYAQVGAIYWMAGQRIDPRTNSPFIWRPDPLSDTLHLMTYSIWAPGNPHNVNPPESCMCLLSANSHTWHDGHCDNALCSVCEIDIWVHKPTGLRLVWTSLQTFLCGNYRPTVYITIELLHLLV